MIELEYSPQKLMPQKCFEDDESDTDSNNIEQTLYAGCGIEIHIS